MPSVNKTETIQLNQWQSNEYPKMDDFNSDNLKIDNKFKVHDTQLSDMDYQTATGTATAITLTLQTLRNGYAKTFVASASNGGVATTINGKKLYKPGTTISPNLITGKAYTVWYNSSGDCFFIKASAEGDADVSHVLATKKFSNDNDTGLTGTMLNNGAVIITPSTVNQAIQTGYHNGGGYVVGDSDLISANIKAGANIFNVQGKASVVDTVDATAVSTDIVLNKTAYINGVKVNGSATIQSLGGKKVATGALTFITTGGYIDYTTVALAFTPSVVIAYSTDTGTTVMDKLALLANGFEMHNYYSTTSTFRADYSIGYIVTLANGFKIKPRSGNSDAGRTVNYIAIE